MTLQGIKDLLNTIGPLVFHYFASEPEGNYIVWAEERDVNSLHADDKKAERLITCTIDYFTKVEDDPVVGQIEAKLDSDDGIAWYLNSVQHERDTGYIHYEWVLEVDGVGQDDS